jgi:hypothetical protein
MHVDVQSVGMAREEALPEWHEGEVRVGEEEECHLGQLCGDRLVGVQRDAAEEGKVLRSLPNIDRTPLV